MGDATHRCEIETVFTHGTDAENKIPVLSSEQEYAVKRHNAHSLPVAFFVWLGELPLAGPMTERGANESAIAINATLAAERENFAMATKQAAEALSSKHAKALAAECQRREQVERLSNQLYVALREGKPIPLGFRLCDEVQHLLNKNGRLSEQLLSALSAIAGIIKQAEQTAGMNWLVKYLQNSNNFKDALDKHDDEVRKPLVDEIQVAIDILTMQDNAGKGRKPQEIEGRNRQAILTLRDALAKLTTHETNKPQ